MSERVKGATILVVGAIIGGMLTLFLADQLTATERWLTIWYAVALAAACIILALWWHD